MKRYLSRIAAYVLVAYTTFALPSCDIKDEELWERVDELFERVEKLEDVCSQMNADIHSIQSVIDAIQNNYSITSVTPLDNEEGYSITFSNGDKIIINHGKDGENGKDGQTPTINIKDMGNGQYAWLLNGEILRDVQGNPIPVNGQDGKDGEDGISAPTPMVKTGSELISSGIAGSWDRKAVYISVNRGNSWTQISADNGNSIFSSVNTDNIGYIEFTLINGTKFTVPRTDDLASLILGEWYGYGRRLNGTYQFNEDGTYIRNEYPENEDGTYEILKDRHGMILKTKDRESYINIISVDEYFMKGESHASMEYLYRPNSFVFDKTEIKAPQKGGTFTINVNAKFPFKISENNSLQESIVGSNIYSSINSSISYTTTCTDKSIEIKIEPNMSNLNLIAEFYIEDTYGNRIGTITVNQEKNTEITPSEISLSEWGKSYVISLFYEIGYRCNELTNMGWDYISGDNSDFKPKLSPDNGTLSYNWTNTYNTINNINKILNQAEQEFPNGPLKAPLQTLRAILYYNLAVYWENVCYVTEENLNEFNSIQQLTTEQLFEKLEPQLKNAIDVLQERAYRDEGYNDFYLSKDVARMTLAQIYMFMKKYSEAELLLQKIKDNNFYGYYSIRYICAYGSTFERQLLYNYTELLLSLSECKLNGDTPADVDIFINEILDEFHLNIENTDKRQIMKEILLKTGIHDGYFAFLKRNGLAKETIGITEDYQLLFPIPQSELNSNPNMVQNPGY